MRGHTYTFHLPILLDPQAVGVLEAIPGVQAKRNPVRAPIHAGGLVHQILVSWGLTYSLGEDRPVPLIEGYPANAIVPPESIRELKPETLKGLTSFQRENLPFHQERMGGIAHWACGSGKTLFGLLWGLSLPGRILVVTRSSTVPQWETEVLSRFTGVEVVCIYGQSGYEIRTVAPKFGKETRTRPEVSAELEWMALFPPEEAKRRAVWQGLETPWGRWLKGKARESDLVDLELGGLLVQRLVTRERMVEYEVPVETARGVSRVWSNDRERYVAEYPYESLAIGDLQRRDSVLDIPPTTRVLVVGWAVLAKRLKGLLQWGAPTLIGDECFAPWSPVATPSGERRIDSLRVGDLVLTKGPTGEVRAQPILRTIVRPRTCGLIEVRLQDGSVLPPCTPEHQIWTVEAGYVAAGCLGKHHHLLGLWGPDEAQTREDRQVLFDAVCQPLQEAQTEGAADLCGCGVQRDLRRPQEQEVLQSAVLSPVAHQHPFGTGGVCTGGSHRGGAESRGPDRDEPDGGPPADAGTQSYAEPRNPGEVECHPSGHGTCSQGPRWEWEGGAGGPEALAGGPRGGVGAGVRGPDGGPDSGGVPFAESLQAGSRESRASGVCRSGWGIPRDPEGSGSGPPQGWRLVPLGVAGISSYQQGDPLRSPGGAGPDSVHDLEVADDHNYFVSGVLVSNCHRGKDPSRWTGTPMPDGTTSYRLKETASASFMALAHRASRMLGLTATPMPDRVRDIYAQADAYDPRGFGQKFKTFAQRYCLSPDSPVLLPTGFYKPLGAIQVGEEVVGWAQDRHQRTLRPVRVLETFMVPEAPRVRLTLESGKAFICTPDHEWLYFIGTDAVNPYRVAVNIRPRPGRREPTKEPIKHLVRLTHSALDWRVTDDYRLGYLTGLIDGDGSSRAELRTRTGRAVNTVSEVFSIDVRCKDKEHLDRGHEYAEVLGVGPRPVVPCDINGLAMWRLGIYTRRGYELLRTWPTEPSVEFWRGWLSGLYDAEGWGLRISQCQNVHPGYHARIGEALSILGLTGTSDIDGYTLHGGNLGLMRFFELVRPVLVRKGVQWHRAHARFKPARDPVVSVEWLEPGPVACLRTETGNFVVDGYGTHNCAAHENTYGHFITTGASNVEELQARLATFTSRVTKSQAHAALPSIGRQILTLTPKELGLRPKRSAKAPKLAVAGGKAGVAEARAQVAAEAKRPFLAQRAVDYAAEDGFKVCVFTGRHDSCERLGADIEAMLVPINRKRAGRGENPVDLWVSHGGIHAARERQKLVADVIYPHPGPAILVGTMDAFSEAINGLHDTDRVLCGYLPYNLLLEQFEGRFSRLGSLRRCVIEYVVAQHTIDEGILDLILGKAAEVTAIMPSEVLDGISHELSGDSHREALLDSLLEKLLAADDDRSQGWKESAEAREQAVQAVPLPDGEGEVPEEEGDGEADAGGTDEDEEG